MKNLLKRAGAATVVAGMLAAVGLAPGVAWADTVALTFNFTANQLDGTPGVSLYAYDGDFWTALTTGQTGNGIGVKIEGIDDRSFGIDLEDGARNRIDASRVSATCTNVTNCTLRITGVNPALQSNGIVFVTPGDSPFDIYHTDHGLYAGSMNLLLEDTNFIIEYKVEQHEDFDGRAYAIWACGKDNSEVCLHLISGIKNIDGATEYYAAGTITDITDPTRKFDKFGGFEDEDYMRGMALASSVERWVKNYTGNNSATVTDVDWSKVDIHRFLRGNPPAEDGVKLQPVGEVQGEGSYTSYGDRNFRLTIYDDNYKAIGLGSLNDLHYIPTYYQDATFVDAIDISGTTAESPAIMHSVLLENTLNIKAGTIGGLDIASVKAVELPNGAVTITKQGGDYKVVFNSNFFDAVTLEIKDAAGKSYYLKVERSVLDTRIDHRDGAITTFTFDAGTSYNDYELIATFVYKDGSSVQMTMENAQWIDDGLGNITHDFEMPGGQNLKIATYKAKPTNANWTENLAGVYFNVRMAGSTKTTYNGTLAGSGRGVFEPAPWERKR